MELLETLDALWKFSVFMSAGSIAFLWSHMTTPQIDPWDAWQEHDKSASL